MTSRWIFLFGASLLLACGGTTSESTASDGGGTDASASDAASDSGNPPQLLDGGACPKSLNPFKACTRADECAIEGLGNCCGPGNYVGISGLSVGDFTQCNPPPNCAGLGCATSSDCRAEDGNQASCAFDTKALGVACNAGLCETFIVPDAGADGG